MTLRDFLPPVLDRAFSAVVRRSFTAAVQSWLRGDDVADGTAVRLSRPYAQSAWVHSAVNHVAGEISGRPLKFYAGEEEFSDPRLAAWWAQPALGPRVAGRPSRLTLAETLRDLAAWAKLEGEFFLLFDDSWALAALNRRNPSALSPFVIARPSRVRLIIQGAEIQGYEYVDAGGIRSVYLPEQVVHWKAFNPYDDFRGLGDLDAALVPAESAFYTGVYVRELMRNNGDTGFIVIGKSGPADDGQREQVKAALREKRAALRAGLARDLFLTGDLAVERPKEQAASNDLTAGKALSHQEVYVAFGVPPSFAEVKASYSVGKDSDYYQLIIRTCQPLGLGIAGRLATVASRMAGRELSAELDWDDHPVMVEVRNSRIDTGLKLADRGMPMREVNEYLDLGLPAFPGWEQGYLPFSVVPVTPGGSTAEPSSAPALAEPADGAEEDPEVARLRLLVLTRSRAALPAPKAAVAVEADTLRGFTCGCGEGCVPRKADRDPAQLARWREHMRFRREQVRGFESRFRRALMIARRETLQKVEGSAGKAVVAKATAADLLFDLASFTAEFVGGMRKQHRLALDAAGRQVFAELGRDDPFSFAPADVLSFLSGRENKLSGVPAEVFGRIRSSLEAGLDAGESTAQLAARVRGEFNAIDRGRSEVIAQTEVAAAFGFGRNEAMRKAGVAYKAWLTSGNANVRPSHQEAGLTYPADGGIPLDEPFVVGGERLMYPGDPAGSPANTINCHCVQLAVEAPEPL